MEPILLHEIPDQIKEITGVIGAVTFPRQGWTSDVAILGDFVVKRVREGQFLSWLADEVRVLKVLNAETTLQVPQVYIFIEEKEQSWALFERLPGETLRAALSRPMSQLKRQSLIYEFGRNVRHLHRTSCPSALRSEEPWLSRMLKRAAYNLENHDVDGNRELLNRLKEKQPESVPQTLIHGDFTIDNVLVKNGEISGVIDWSGGDFGDPRYDVSLAIRKFNAHDRDVFFEGYGEKIITEKDFQYFNHGLYEFF